MRKQAELIFLSKCWMWFLQAIWLSHCKPKNWMVSTSSRRWSA